MNAPCGALQLLLATTLQLHYCAATTILPHPTNEMEPVVEPVTEVVRFLEVFSRSACQAKETMVSLDKEYPDLVISHLIVPSCVALKRCVGCCADESAQCMPSRTYTVTMEVLLLSKFQRSHLQQLTFEEHATCECRPKEVYRLPTHSPSCAPCPDRKKRVNPLTCECVCKRDSVRCQQRGWELNKATCRCVKHRRRSGRKAKA
ncbi:vascular endothelial growth factor B [Podarcis muralis]